MRKMVRGGTALIVAALFDRAEIVKLLCDAGADVNARNEEGETALIWAAMGGKIEIVKILIDAGADVNAKDNDGCTALWWALDEETARILRAAGGIE